MHEFTFAKTDDLDLVKTTISAPSNMPFQFEDDYDRSKFFAMDSLPEPCIFVKVMKGEEYFGLFLLIPIHNGTAECHLALLPNAYGKTTEIMEAWLKWVWANTPFTKLRGPVLEYNRLAAKLVESVGFRFVGFNIASWLKDGIKHNLVIYEINEPILEER